MNKWLGIQKWLLLLIATMLLQVVGWSQGTSPGILRGSVYDDSNVNELRDLGEVGLPGISFVIVGPAGSREITSGAGGVFESLDLAPGHYTLMAPLQVGTRYLVTDSPIGVIEFNINPGQVTDIGLPYHEPCVRFNSEPKVLWNLDANGVPNGTATITFSIFNGNPFPIGWIYVTPQFGTVSPSPIQVNPPIAPNSNGTFSFVISGVQPGQRPCFRIDFHSPDLVDCCTEKICVQLPECDCYQEISHVVECLPNGDFAIQLVLQNLSPYNVSQVWALGPAGVTVSPTVTNVAFGPGGTFTLNLTASGQNLGGTDLCIKIMFYSGGTRCCVKDLCIPLPNCNTCDNRSPVCYAIRPVYDAVDQATGANYNGAGWSQLNGKTVAAITCFSSYTNDDPNTAMVDNLVFGYMNLDQYQCAPPPLGQQWTLSPIGFHNGLDGSTIPLVPDDCKWTKKYMGNVFAITFDNQGNAYVAQTSCYNADYAPLIQDFNAPGTAGRNHQASPNELADRRLHGRIFKIANLTGKVTIFNEDTSTTLAGWNGLPSNNDPGITSLPNAYPTQRPELELSSQGFPEVGDVTFDYDHNQIFATSMDDGKIYRFNMSGVKQGVAFDPWVADTGATYGDGFADWDENIWACKYHRGRVYYSRWREDFDNYANPAGSVRRNEVWSVAIDATGNFIPSSNRKELETPELFVTPYSWIPVDATAPISDITFNQNSSTGEAEMVLAERGMGQQWAATVPYYQSHMTYHAVATNPTIRKDSFTNTYPHRSRGLKYRCNPATNTWQLVPGTQPGALLFELGLAVGNMNSSGGVDFDFDSRGCSGPGLGNRDWFQVDYMPVPGGVAYGLQGIPLNGGNLGNSIVVDLNGALNITGNPIGGTTDKTTNGDVEIPCPPDHPRLTGRFLFPYYLGNMAGRQVRAQIFGNGGSINGTSSVRDDGSVEFAEPLLDGSYVVYIEVRGHLIKRVDVQVANGVADFGTLEPTPADIDCNNEVAASDFALLAEAFGTAQGDPGFNPDADIDGDSEVGPADFGILSALFGEVGDAP